MPLVASTVVTIASDDPRRPIPLERTAAAMTHTNATRLAASVEALRRDGLRFARRGEKGRDHYGMLEGALIIFRDVVDLDEPAPTQATADALAASLWAAGEVAGDPWALAQGVPVGRGAAPLSGPCCGEEGL